MATTRNLGLSAVPPVDVPGFLRRLSAVAHALRDAWLAADRAAASRRNLERMDARMLTDIGVSRAQAVFEASRWH